MDWSTNGYISYSTHPQEEVEDEEDFYGPGQSSTNGGADAIAGAVKEEQQPATGQLADFFTNSNTAKQEHDNSVRHAAQQQGTQKQEAEKKQQEEANKKYLEDLRARLMAKKQASSRPGTPAGTPAKAKTPANEPSPAQNKMEQKATANGSVNPPPSDDFGIHTLLAEAEGKAAAEAQAARTSIAASRANGNIQQQQQKRAPIDSGNMEINQVRPSGTKDAPLEQSQAMKPTTTSQCQQPTDDQSVKTPTNQQPTKLNDPYYDDLGIWLEFTGYHDVAFRESKLSTYKKRKTLEQEAARIAAALEELSQREKTDLESLRPSAAHAPTETPMAPPPLPTAMPSPNARLLTNGTKRHHSPEVPSSEKAVRRNGDPGFRIRGADDASGPPPSRRGRSPLDRRLSFPDRRRSFDEMQDRDPSLERRQRNYKRDAGRESGGRFAEPFTPSREAPRPFNGRQRDGMSGYSGTNRAVSYSNGPGNYRGSAGLDLRKGGVRYFMIKSWNHDNVITAMKDGLWATQEKNEQMLTEAFHTSRHVILLYSVNKSMAFQGYALMTSPPTPSLPKPPFCTKLNWKTSPAFTIRWLAQTPVHFRMVGHLKNTCNPDEDGVPRAVLVGKDGQEISQDAGMGVVWILDEAEEVEGRGRA